MLDARIASAVRKIISDTSFRRRVSVEEQRAHKYNRFLKGRQTAKMINGHFQSTGAYHAGTAQAALGTSIPEMSRSSAKNLHNNFSSALVLDHASVELPRVIHTSHQDQSLVDTRLVDAFHM